MHAKFAHRAIGSVWIPPNSSAHLVASRRPALGIRNIFFYKFRPLLQTLIHRHTIILYVRPFPSSTGATFLIFHSSVTHQLFLSYFCPVFSSTLHLSWFWIDVDSRATGWTVRGSNPITGKRFSLLENRPDRFWAHPASYSLGTGVSFPEVECLGRKIDNSAIYSVEIQDEWSCNSSPFYAFMTWTRTSFLNMANGVTYPISYF